MILGVIGHRPYSLGKGVSSSIVLHNLAKQCISRFDPGMVVTNLSEGWGQACASACLALRIPFTATLPYEGQEMEWEEGEQASYRYFLDWAARIKYTSFGGYLGWKMTQCARDIVDQSDHMLILCDGSGIARSRMAVDYAIQQKKPVDNCWNIWVRIRDKRDELVKEIDRLDSNRRRGRITPEELAAAEAESWNEIV